MDHLTRWDVFIGCLGAMTPLAAVLLATHMQNRGDKKRQDNRLSLLLVEHPLHSHVEHEGTLTVDGVRYPRKNGNY